MDFSTLPNTSAASIVTLVVLVVFLQAASATSSLLVYNEFKRAPVAPSAPPGAVFMVVWPVLYALAGVALWLQLVTPSSAGVAVLPAVRWASICLMAVQLIAGFAWMPLFATGRTKAATWLVLGMLIVSVTGVVLVAGVSGSATALWAPYLVWLTFALVLSAQVNTVTQ